MSAAVITELATWLRLYLARTSTGKDVTLTFAIGLYGVIGMGRALVPAGVVGVPEEAAGAIVGEGGATGGNLVKLINVISSGLKSSS